MIRASCALLGHAARQAPKPQASVHTSPATKRATVNKATRKKAESGDNSFPKPPAARKRGASKARPDGDTATGQTAAAANVVSVDDVVAEAAAPLPGMALSHVPAAQRASSFRGLHAFCQRYGHCVTVLTSDDIAKMPRSAARHSSTVKRIDAPPKPPRK